MLNVFNYCFALLPWEYLQLIFHFSVVITKFLFIRNVLRIWFLSNILHRNNMWSLELFYYLNFISAGPDEWGKKEWTGLVNTVFCVQDLEIFIIIFLEFLTRTASIFKDASLFQNFLIKIQKVIISFVAFVMLERFLFNIRYINNKNGRVQE